jgi:hypothetical protein
MNTYMQLGLLLLILLYNNPILDQNLFTIVSLVFILEAGYVLFRYDVRSKQ